MDFTNFKDLLDVTTNIFSILSSIFVIAAVSYLYNKFTKRIGTIYVDDEWKLVTKKRKVSRIFYTILRKPEKFNELRIKTKSKTPTASKHGSGTSVFVWAMQQQRFNKKEKIIKRGLFLLLSDKFREAIPVIESLHHNMDEIVIEFFNRFANLKDFTSYSNNINKAAIVLDVFIPELGIKTCLNLTNEQLNSLSEDFKQRSKCKMAEWMEVSRVNKQFEREVILDFIIKCALNDAFWEDNRFILKKDISKIFYSMYWEVGLS